MFPLYWSQFVEDNKLDHCEVCIPEESDLSGLGAEFRLYNSEGSQKEAEAFYPGIVVASDGYVPVAYCLDGSGDPYFINSHDGLGGPLYRIYHDAVKQGGYDHKEAIAIVLKNYEDVTQFVR